MRLTIAAVLACLLLTGCASAMAGEPDAREDAVQLQAVDKPAPIEREQRTEEPVAADAADAEEAPDEEYVEPACEEAYCEPTYEPSGGLTREGGVNHHGGRTETYYSSNVLYHHRTGEWTVDEEGFYRDAEGRYVVAASDMEQGTVFETSKGEAVVLDTGCSAGVTDFYVAW